MAAFDRVLSDIPEMDTALDNIRFGDNVVWRVSKLIHHKQAYAYLTTKLFFQGRRNHLVYSL